MAFLPMESGGGGELKKVTIGSSNSSSSRTFNVASTLPDVYSKLTLDNFVLSQASQTFTTTTADNVEQLNNILSSYNSSTGVLTCNVSRRIRNGSYCYVTYTVSACYVE